MNKYLLRDTTDNVIPITVVIADNKIDALCKSIKGILQDEILSIEDICDNLGISLEEFDEINTYE